MRAAILQPQDTAGEGGTARERTRNLHAQSGNNTFTSHLPFWRKESLVPTVSTQSTRPPSGPWGTAMALRPRDQASTLCPFFALECGVCGGPCGGRRRRVRSLPGHRPFPGPPSRGPWQTLGRVDEAATHHSAPATCG